ncbi:MAG: M4 family metallopeptidase [Planctomycetes bacterium]|nr:M4 family metallopeptidase [Planctomycetota bacterium]
MTKLDGLKALLKRDPQLTFRSDAALGVIVHLRGDLADVGAPGEKQLATAAQKFLKQHAPLFGPVAKGKFTVLAHSKDARGGTSVTLQQHHGPYRVHGGSLRVHVTKDGRLDTVRSSLFPDLARVPKKAKLSSTQALAAALKATRAKGNSSREPELLVVRYGGKPHLAWEVRIDDARNGERGVPAKWVVRVDAANGKVLNQYDDVQTAGPTVGAGTGYYSGAGTINTWFNDTTFQLRDTTRTAAGGPEIVVDDEDGAAPSEDADNDWNASSTTPRHAHQGPEVDALRYAGAVIDYFQTVHGRNSFDGAGADARIIAHLGTNYDNGYWDGAKVNLGDGSGAAPGFDYATSDDWLAHEFTHAYTQFTCGLVYQNESGALNEAFSDVFAAFITGDWLVFEDTWLSASAPAARNMIEPTNGDQWDSANAIPSVLAGHQPSHYSVRYTGFSDNGGVHINSGIINHLFYLLTVGGTHAKSAIAVNGIGQAAAESLLWRCMTDQLVGQPNATFLDFRVAMLDAAQDLFPGDLALQRDVARAFDAVGIGSDLYVRDNLADNGVEPYTGTYLWASPDVINRTSPSANPAVQFANLSSDSLWENVEFGQDNFVYVRVQNRGLLAGDATIQVYLSSASTFSNPSAWIHIGTLTEANITPGSLRIAGPLTFPKALIPAPGHYCMIAVIQDALDPVPLFSSITTVSDYLDFVRKRNNVAYRNMDVVDVLPNAPGVIAFEIGPMPGMRDYFGVRLDLGRFVPGAKVRLRAPRGLFAGAIARGLKLAARNEREDVYDVVVGKAAAAFELCDCRHGKDERALPGLGFDRVLLEKPGRVRIEYLVPQDAWNAFAKGKARRAPAELGLRQLWKGEVLGAVGVRVRGEGQPPKLAKSPKAPKARVVRRRRDG